jgi:hypothetical protein
VRLELPAVLDQISTDASKLQPTLQLSIPVAPGQLNLVLAPGTVENEEAVIMDTTVIVNRAIQPGCHPPSALCSLKEGQSVIVGG